MCTHCALDQENMAVVQVLLLGYIGKVPQILRVLTGAVDVLNLVLANSTLQNIIFCILCYIYQNISIVQSPTLLLTSLNSTPR